MPTDAVTIPGLRDVEAPDLTPPLEPLWEPLTVGPVELPNRVASPAHETGYGTVDFENVGLNVRYIAYVAERARGGAGLVIPGGATVEPLGAGRGHLGIWSRDVVPSYRELSDAVHEHGGRVFIQLFHCGLQLTGTHDVDDRHPLMAPSSLPSAVYGRIGKEMELSDIERVVTAYGTAARNMRDAGVDGLELSACHGYLLHSFLSPLMNRRTDGYGGDAAARARLLLEVIAEIREQVGRDVAVGVRLSYEDHLGGPGISLEDTDTTIKLLVAGGEIDYVSVSGGTYPTNHMMIPPAAAHRVGHLAPQAARAKGLVGEIPVLLAAGIRTIEDAARVIAGGGVDLVGMTRALIADPELVNKARGGHSSYIRRCAGTNQGCVRRVGNHMMLACTVNPRAGRELVFPERPVQKTALKLLVIGAGPAGLKAADEAAQSGHVVTLVEREAEVGGQIRRVSSLPGRDTWLEVIADLEASAERSGVDIRRRQALTVEGVRAFGADRVAIATGSTSDKTGYAPENPTRNVIPGAELAYVITAYDALGDLDTIGARVLLIDGVGDMAGVGLASLLAQRGHDVELVTSQLSAAGGLIWTFEFPTLIPQALEAGVRMSAETMVNQITSDHVELGDIWGRGQRSVEVDTVILNMTRSSDRTLAAQLEEAGIQADRIGDCVAPRDLDESINDGYEWGRGV